MDYNTQREKLILSEYGREIQKMVDLAISLPTKEERTRCAHAIIRQMENKNPQVRESNDYQQTLWDHLYLMSRKQLDIDWPYDMSDAENILSKPAPMEHPTRNGNAHLRHYGHLMIEVFERLKTMPEGPERETLVQMVANQMKQDLFVWNRDAMNETLVAEDIERYTRGEVKLNLDEFRFAPVGMPSASQLAGVKKKKRKA